MNRMSLWIALAASWVAGLITVLVAGDPWVAYGSATQGRPTVAVGQMTNAGP